VNSSIPPSGSSVSSDTPNITLTFRDQIALSVQNISIYQAKDDGNSILRQGFSAKSGFCTIVSSNDSAVTCQIFKSTFNQPGATYDVVVDNDFVMSKSLNQPLTGVTKGNWVYYGGMHFTNSNVLLLVEYRLLTVILYLLASTDTEGKYTGKASLPTIYKKCASTTD